MTLNEFIEYCTSEIKKKYGAQVDGKPIKLKPLLTANPHSCNGEIYEVILKDDFTKDIYICEWEEEVSEAYITKYEPKGCTVYPHMY